MAKGSKKADSTVTEASATDSTVVETPVTETSAEPSVTEAPANGTTPPKPGTTAELEIMTALAKEGVDAPAGATIEEMEAILAEAEIEKDSGSAAVDPSTLPPCFGELFEPSAEECRKCGKVEECEASMAEKAKVTELLQEEEAVEAEAAETLEEEKAARETEKAEEDAKSDSGSTIAHSDKTNPPADERKKASPAGERKKAAANVRAQASFARNAEGKLVLVEDPEAFTAAGNKIEIAFTAGDKLVVDNPKSKFNGRTVEFVHYSVKYNCLRTRAEGISHTADFKVGDVRHAA
jgi:hypothetical protein